MPSDRTRSSPAGPAPSCHDLVTAVSRLVDEATSGELDSSLWSVAVAGADLELRHRGIAGHPFDELAGFRARPECQALGVRAVGRAWHLDRPGAAPVRVAATIVVARGGSAASRLRWLGAEVVDDQPGPVEGLIADACRRSLGVATAPPQAGPSSAWALLWLDRLVEAAADPARRPCSVDAAVALHPAAQAASPDGSWVRADPDGLVDAARRHAEAWNWARLRREPAALGPVAAELPTRVAEWMDDGLFSRWLRARLPPPVDLLDTLADVLSPAVARHVAEIADTLLVMR